MRALILVPIVHSETDLGSMANEVRSKYVEAFGKEALAKHVNAVEAMWDGICAMLSNLPLAWDRVRLYQDGLPVCGYEEKIVRDLAAAGSRNHKLLLDLMTRGATLMGTEDPLLVLREYRLGQELARAVRAREPLARLAALERDMDDVMSWRDAFIAERIDATLTREETGVLLIGLLHRVDRLLEGKLEVTHLIHRLPLNADPWRRLKEISKNGN